MISSQISGIEKQRFIDAQPASKLDEWNQELAKVNAEIETLTEQVSQTKSTIESKQSQIESIEKESQKPISQRASEILSLQQEIRLHHIEVQNFENLIVSLKEKTPELQESIMMLSNSLTWREKRQKVEAELEEFLVVQAAYIAALEKLFKVWKANNRPFNWSFPPLLIVAKEKMQYHKISG